MSLSLEQMTDHVAQVTGATDPASREAITMFLRRRWVMVWDAQLWDDSKVVLALATTSPEVILPSWVSRVLAVKTTGADSLALTPMEVGTLWAICPRAYEDEGEVQVYTELPPVGTHTHPDGKKLRFVSSAANDVTQVRIRGIYNGLLVDETLTLSGQSPITSANYFDEVYTLSKKPTTGYVQINASIPAYDGPEVRLVNGVLPGGQFYLSIPAAAEKYYEVQSASSVAGPWTKLLVPSVVQGSQLIFAIPSNTTSSFYRAVAVTPPLRELQVLLPEETSRQHLRVRLHRAFTDSSLILTVVAKKCVRPLLHPQDTPELNGCENLLIAYAVADTWERLRQVAKSQVKLQEAGALMASLIERDTIQKARTVQLVPDSAQYA